jgi:hypothetical protein
MCPISISGTSPPREATRPINRAGGLPFIISNGITTSASDKVTQTNKMDETNKTLITKSTGLISGSFANPSNLKQTIKVGGVILQGQTNAQGYFLNSNQSGLFLLEQQ